MFMRTVWFALACLTLIGAIILVRLGDLPDSAGRQITDAAQIATRH